MDKKSLVDNSVRANINTSGEQSDCGYIPVDTPFVVCPQDIVLQPKYPFIVGDSITTQNMVYGIYEFRVEADFTIDAAKLALEISTYPQNFNTTYFNVNGSTISIDSNTNSEGDPNKKAVYHLIRLPLTVTPVIKDVASQTITNAFTIYSDVEYNFYLLDTAIAPSIIEYTLSSWVDIITKFQFQKDLG